MNVWEVDNEIAMSIPTDCDAKDNISYCTDEQEGSASACFHGRLQTKHATKMSGMKSIASN